MLSRRFRYVGMAAAFSLLISGCGDSPTETREMVDSGSWYRTGFRWPHDGNPYESQHFTVYSDAASLAARQKLAEIAEDLLAELTADFGISVTLFKWPPGQSKIHIYTYKNYFESAWGGWGYYGGFMIYSLDHPIRNTELGNYTRVAKHELMHAIEGLLKGSDNPNLVDVWLTEGIAEHVAGGTQSIPVVTTLAQLEELVSTFGELNPIAMHQYQYPSIPNVGSYYYVMFELAVRYLLDPNGGAQEKTGVRDVYLDASDGVPFAQSFQERLGHDLEEYENRFFELIRAYLSG